jgi:predicted nucleotidyltransferase
MEITYDPKPISTEQLQALSQDVKQALTELDGDRLDRVVLFGSYARGDFHNESDVDYLVVLRDETVNSFQEIRLMVNATYDLCDK